jgi:hypothetical protein
VYGFGAAGVATTFTALTGIAAAAWESRCVLNFYAYQLLLLVMGQAALTIALYITTGAAAGHEPRHTTPSSLQGVFARPAGLPHPCGATSCTRKAATLTSRSHD